MNESTIYILIYVGCFIGHIFLPSAAGDDSPILEPLHFETSDREVFIASSGEQSCPCILCDEVFNLPKDKDAMLKHFVIVHKLVIADVALIADLNKWVQLDTLMRSHPVIVSTIIIKIVIMIFRYLQHLKSEVVETRLFAGSKWKESQLEEG